jgi:hypothetical protein
MRTRWLSGPKTFDRSVAEGLSLLNAELTDRSGPVVVLGVSQGALIIRQEKAQLAADPNRPAKDQLSFVTIGDPSNRDGGIMAKLPNVTIPGLELTFYHPAPDTIYDTVEIVREYDGLADFPDRPQPLAVANALLGIPYVHFTAYGPADDPTTPGTLVTESTNPLGGVTTHYVIPSAQLPLTRPLRDLGVPANIVDALDRQLRPLIDSAYNRPKPTAAGGAKATKVKATAAHHKAHTSRKAAR